MKTILSHKLILRYSVKQEKKKKKEKKGKKEKKETPKRKIVNQKPFLRYTRPKRFHRRRGTSRER